MKPFEELYGLLQSSHPARAAIPAKTSPTHDRISATGGIFRYAYSGDVSANFASSSVSSPAFR